MEPKFKEGDILKASYSGVVFEVFGARETRLDGYEYYSESRRSWLNERYLILVCKAEDRADR